MPAEVVPKTVGKQMPRIASKKKAAPAKQVDLPGLENRDIPEIETAAEAYREVRDDRIALSKDEATAKAALIKVMKDNKRTVYTRNGLSITLEEIDNVKVKTAKKDDEGDDE